MENETTPSADITQDQQKTDEESLKITPSVIGFAIAGLLTIIFNLVFKIPVFRFLLIVPFLGWIILFIPSFLGGYYSGLKNRPIYAAKAGVITGFILVIAEIIFLFLGISGFLGTAGESSAGPEAIPAMIILFVVEVFIARWGAKYSIKNPNLLKKIRITNN